jgi:hypothetical protein
VVLGVQNATKLNIGSQEDGIKIDFLRSVAHKKGGRLISKKYINSGEPLEWECANGHKWFAKYDHIKKRLLVSNLFCRNIGKYH